MNAARTIFCKLRLGSRLHHIMAVARQRAAVLVHLQLQLRHAVLSPVDVQIYLQDFVHLPSGRVAPSSCTTLSRRLVLSVPEAMARSPLVLLGGAAATDGSAARAKRAAIIVRHDMHQHACLGPGLERCENLERLSTQPSKDGARGPAAKARHKSTRAHKSTRGHKRVLRA